MSFSFFFLECPSRCPGSLPEGTPLRVGWFQRWCIFCCITESGLICLSWDEAYKVYWEPNYHASWPHNRTWRGTFLNGSCLPTLFFLGGHIGMDILFRPHLDWTEMCLSCSKKVQWHIVRPCDNIYNRYYFLLTLGLPSSCLKLLDLKAILFLKKMLLHQGTFISCRCFPLEFLLVY